MLKFGFNITGSNILTYLMRNIDNILIGGSWHTVLLGIYAKAYELLYFPILQISGIVTNVAIPVLSRLQSDSERFRNYFIRGLSLITACAMPVMVLLFVAADKVVIVLLGDQWFEVIPVMVLLGPASFVWTFTMASGWVFISTGRADRFMRWQIIGIVLTTSAFVIGLRWGAVGIAGACSLVTAILQYPAFVYCFRGTPLKVRDVGLAIWRPSFASLIAGVTTVLFNRIYALGGNTVARLATDVFCFGLIYLLSCWILPGGRRWFADIFSLTSDLKANKRS